MIFKKKFQWNLWFNLIFLNTGSGTWGNRGLLICNYGNGGNIPGKPIFTSGKAGSKCPKGSYNFRGLCRTKRREYENDDLDENNQELEKSKEELEE